MRRCVQDAAKHRGRNVGNEELAFQLGEKRVQLGVGMEARAIHKDSGIAEDVVVYFGIIDYLQVRRWKALKLLLKLHLNAES